MSVITCKEFKNFFKYFKDEKHQVKAIEMLYEDIDADLLTDASDWIREYRNKSEVVITAHISKEQLAYIWGCADSLIKDSEIDEMNKCLDMYAITTAPRIRHFLS